MRAVIFDVDGVLIDSVAVHRAVWAAWAQHHRLDSEVVWRATFGRRPEDTVAETAPGLDPIAERSRLDALLAAQEHRITIAPGAKALLEELGSTPSALATSGSRPVTIERFRRLGLPLPRVAVFGEDVQAGKPDPECYVCATEQLGFAPGDCVVVEDAPAGIAAGRAAGCWVLAVGSTHSHESLMEANEIYDDVPAVAERLAELLNA